MSLRYDVYLSAKVNSIVTVEADSKEDAQDNWAKTKLYAARMDAVEEARQLDDYEFDVDNVLEHEE